LKSPHILILLWNGSHLMGAFYNKALTKLTSTTTVGPDFSETTSDFPLSPGEPLKPLIEKLERKPDVILCFYSKPDYFPPDLWEINIPKIWYVYDTHLHFDELSTTAYLFDLVICTDEPTKEKMIHAGIENATSLGFAADKDFYYREYQANKPRKYQIGFAGNLANIPQFQTRRALIRQLQKKYDVKVIEHHTFSGAAVGDFYQDCQLVLNHAIKDDLNMRVPEVLLSGRPLVTPNVTGIELQYKDSEHLFIYENNNIEELIDRLLAAPDQAELVAQQGQNWVLNNHTYDQRAQDLLEKINDLILKFKAGQIPHKNKQLKQFAQFNYHRFRYIGDGLTWLNHHWEPKNAPEKALKLILKAFILSLKVISKASKRPYFQDNKGN